MVLEGEATHDFVVEMLQFFNGCGILLPGILWLLLLLMLR